MGEKLDVKSRVYVSVSYLSRIEDDLRCSARCVYAPYTVLSLLKQVFSPIPIFAEEPPIVLAADLCGEMGHSEFYKLASSYNNETAGRTITR